MTEKNISSDASGRLAGLAGRLQNNSGFMAQVLAIYKKQEALNDQILADQLNIIPEMLTRLALCRKPDPNSPQFADQIRQIASYTNTETAQIANIIRQVESLQKLSERVELITASETTSSPYPVQKGLLAAARDRIDEIEEYLPLLPEEDQETTDK